MTCTGCKLSIELYSPLGNYTRVYDVLPNNSPFYLNGSRGFVASAPMVGIGQGALSGITGYTIGTVSVYLENRFTGRCADISGFRITGYLSGNALYDADVTGSYGYSYVTGCDQVNPCKVGKVWFSFSGNPDLYAGTPSAITSIQSFSAGATNGIEGMIPTSYPNLSSGNRHIPSGDWSVTNLTLNCGRTFFGALDAVTIIPGYTGHIRSIFNAALTCGFCVPG